MFRRVAIGIVVLFALMVATVPFITVNYTTSYPVGIYYNLYRDAHKGDLVTFCPPDNDIFQEALERGYLAVGFCPQGYGFLIKKILAAKKDEVEFTPEGVFVNGVLIVNTAPKLEDSKRRPMPRVSGKYVLGENEVLLLSDYNPWSFDARYFGILDRTVIMHPIKPLVTW